MKASAIVCEYIFLLLSCALVLPVILDFRAAFATELSYSSGASKK